MMKRCFRFFCFNVLFFCAFSTFAQVIGWQDDQRQTKENTRDLANYLLNLGGYLGYNLKQQPPPPDTTTQFSRTLVDINKLKVNELFLLNASLGAMPMVAVVAQFIPNNFPGAALINNWANYSFKNPQYNSPDIQSGKISVNPLIDQQTYQKDPVSQAVLNILGTPEAGVCRNWSATSQGQQPLCQNKILSQVIGEIPLADNFFSYSYNDKIIGQLNINSLISPLLYSTENSTAISNFSGNQPETNKLVALSQSQQAANFIRYATGAVTPITLADQETYNKLYFKATAKDPLGSSGPTAEKIQAQNTLNNYLANLRVYAAQSSVGIGNLYYILSKRIAQNQGEGSNVNTTTSQALSEYNMATWRLKQADPSKPNEKAWVDQINNASAATVQKEIAILLSEINYQMYLTRQQQERMLLTQSIMLIQNTKPTVPALPTAGSGPTPP